MPPVESSPAIGTGQDFDRHFRRAVWITALITMLVSRDDLRRQGRRRT